MNAATIIISAIVGGASGAIAGLFGDIANTGFPAGLAVGSAIGLIATFITRPDSNAPIGFVLYPLAGFIGGLVAAIATNAGWVGVFVACGSGWVIGCLPVFIMSKQS